MTKKDYELIAECIKYGIEQEYPNAQNIEAIEKLANYMSLKLGFKNPRFDRDKFLTACGFKD